MHHADAADAAAAGFGFGERRVGQRQQFADRHARCVVGAAEADAGFDIEEGGDDGTEFFAQPFGRAREVSLGRQDEPYGRFAWILDCDGLKVELWEQLGPAPD